jgi:DNA-binding MarR family transcriptional regulator
MPARSRPTPPAEPTPADQVPIPALLRAARSSYGHEIRSRLAAAGYDDLPRNGPFVLGGIVNRGGTSAQLVRELGVSKQAASQLIDTLVLRGYLERQPDAEDRGRAAAALVRSGVQAVDSELAERLAPEQLAGLRAGLIALCDIRDRFEEQARAAERGS